MSVQRSSSIAYVGEDAKNFDAKTPDGRVSWWQEKDEQAGAALVENVRRILLDKTDYLSACERHLRMYRNLAMQGTVPMRILRLADAMGSTLMPRIGMNVVRPMCNTVKSKIGKTRPRVMFTTDGGGRAQKDLARSRELFVDGLFYQEDVYAKSRRCLLDATVFGHGVMSVASDGKRPEYARVFPPEFVVDRIEGANCEPRNVQRIRFIDREVLARKFPKFEKQIRGMKPKWMSELNIWWRTFNSAEHTMLMVTLGWHLPSEPGADDGRRTIGLEDLTLANDPYKDDEHPFEVIRWSQSPDGFDGMGLAEELVGIQAEINRLVRRIQTSMHLLSNPYVLINQNSGLAPGTVQGIPGTVLKHNGLEPKIYAPQTVHPEVFAHLDRLYQRAFEIAGVSQLSASSKIPANLESGRAILVHEDVQSDRFADFEIGEWQQFHVRLGIKGIHTAARTGYEVALIDPTSSRMRKVKAKDLGLDEDDWICKAWPTSILPATPEGRLDIIERTAAQGLTTDVEEKIELLQDLDITRAMRRKLSGRRYVERIIESMLYHDGPYIAPDSAMPLQKCIAIAQDLYLEGLADGADEDALAKVSSWIYAAIALDKMGQKAAAPPMGPAMTPPPGPLPGMAPPMNAGPDAMVAPPVPPAMVA